MLSTTGEGLILPKLGCSEFLRQDLRQSLRSCSCPSVFTGVKRSRQQRITAAGGYLGQMPGATGCGAGGYGAVRPRLAFEVISFWSVSSCEAQRFVELGSCGAALRGLSGLTRLWQGRPQRSLSLCPGAVRTWGGAGVDISTWSPGLRRTHSSATSSLRAQPGAPRFHLLPSTEAILSLLLLLFVYSSPHPICLSLLLPPLPFPSLSLLPLVPCKRLIILTGSAMAFISLRRPRNVCEHLL